MMTLFYITNDPRVALIAEEYGVDRIWVDLETIGKAERQPGNTVKSHHSVQDIRVIKPMLTHSEMLVRVQSWNENSETEIDEVVEAGADIIMLPMWKSVEEVGKFINAVRGRAKTTLLLETKEAVECLDEVLELGGFDEIHIGLNDLHLSYGLTFMFELLADGTVELLCKKIAEKNIPYGYGGIARIGEGALPAEWILKEHFRLGSTRAILSRSFCNLEETKDLQNVRAIFAANMALIREYERKLPEISRTEIEENRRAVKRRVSEIVKEKKEISDPQVVKE